MNYQHQPRNPGTRQPQQRQPQQRANQRPPQQQRDPRSQQQRPAANYWNSPQSQQQVMFAPFLTKEEKQELAYSGDVVEIKNVRHQPNANYGPQWAIDIVWLGKFNEAGGNDFTLTLQSNQMRDAAMEGMRDFLKNNYGATIPVLMIVDVTDRGQEFYNFVQPGNAEPDETPAPNGEYDEAPLDEMPF